MTYGVQHSEQMIAQIRKLSQQGRSIRDIAKITGVSKSSVEKYVKIFPK